MKEIWGMWFGDWKRERKGIKRGGKDYLDLGKGGRKGKDEL